MFASNWPPRRVYASTIARNCDLNFDGITSDPSFLLFPTFPMIRRSLCYRFPTLIRLFPDCSSSLNYGIGPLLPRSPQPQAGRHLHHACLTLGGGQKHCSPPQCLKRMETIRLRPLCPNKSPRRVCTRYNPTLHEIPTYQEARTHQPI